MARFRLGRAGGLTRRAHATDGEVEDYAVRVYGESPLRNFGDAPDTTYATLRADFGPSHFLGGPYLGSTVDEESDGQGNAVATGDGSDDDGVHFGELMLTGLSADIEVTSSPGGGVLDFFFDFNANGVFGDVASEVFQANARRRHAKRSRSPCRSMRCVGTTYARFRISSAGGLGPIYWAPDGEVEDYQVVILPGPDDCSEFEYFDGVTAPALPAGWTMVAEQDPTMVWTTVASGSDTAPNHAFIPDIEPSTPPLSTVRLDPFDLSVRGPRRGHRSVADSATATTWRTVGTAVCWRSPSMVAHGKTSLPLAARSSPVGTPYAELDRIGARSMIEPSGAVIPAGTLTRS